MELTTIAKPYANAIFALAQQNDSYESWKAILAAGATIANDALMCEFIAAPSADKGKKADVVAAVFKSALGRDLDKQELAFIALLLENERIAALPSILALFDAKVRLSSKTKVFRVISAYALGAKEEEKITNDLADIYKTSVSINTEVDENLLAGVVIKEGDKVVDLSIKARTSELGSRLSIN